MDKKVDLSKRTSVIRDAILEAVGKNVQSDFITEKELFEIDSLYLQEKGIKSLKKGDFAGLTGLRSLGLRDNKLKKISNGVFEGLSSLIDLDLSDNKLEILGNNVFKGLDNLDGLYLCWNNFKNLPEGIFDGLENLSFLYLGNNQFKTFEKNSFRGLKKLEYLSLEDIGLKEFPKEAFSDFPSLKKLILNDNEIESFGVGDLDGLTGLRDLEFAFNKFSELPDKKVFENLKKIKRIWPGGDFDVDELLALFPSKNKEKIGSDNNVKCSRKPKKKDRPLFELV